MYIDTENLWRKIIIISLLLIIVNDTDKHMLVCLNLSLNSKVDGELAPLKF